jgi:hypothetical protein
MRIGRPLRPGVRFVSPRAFLLLACAAMPALCFAAPAPSPRTERRHLTFVPPENLEDLIKIAEKGGDVRRGAAFLKPKYAELDDLAKAYRQRRRGGIGVGPPASNDGVATKLWQIRDRDLTAAQLRDQKADVARVAHSASAITEVARLFAPNVPHRNGKGAWEWHAFVDEVQQGARDLVRANRAGDARGVRAAASKVVEGCIICHDAFRDN